MGSQWWSHDWTGLLCTSMHNNFSATCEENSLPCCNKCGHLELRDVMGEGMEMTPSSATGMDGAPQSSRILSGIQSFNCTYSEFKQQCIFTLVSTILKVLIHLI